MYCISIELIYKRYVAVWLIIQIVPSPFPTAYPSATMQTSHKY